MQKLAIILGCLLYCIGVLGDSYYYLTIKNDTIKSLFDFYFRYFTTFRNGIFFGFVFTILYKTFQKQSRWYLAIVSALSIFVMFAEYFFVKENQYALDYNMYFSLLIFTPAFFHLLIQTPINISTSTALFFREYSMGIYFLHPLIKELTFFDVGIFRFPFIIVECIIFIFFVKKLKIPVLSFLLK